MSGLGGLRGTGDWGTDERPKNFRENILWFNPNGTSPIFALTSKAGSKSVDDPEFAWWSEGMKNVRLQVNQSGNIASGDTLITVDSADPTSTTMGVNFGTATHLKPGDLLLVEPSADNATFDHEIIRVEQVLSDTQFIASRGVGGTTAATIPDDRNLTLIGSAYAEGTAEPRAASRNPIKFSNFTQIFKESYELTKTAEATYARTGNAWSNDKKRKAFDHARAIEWSIMFGRKAETTGENGKPLRFMGGLREFIPSTNVTVFGSAVTSTSLLNAISPAFDFDTEAGDTRLAFAGNTAIMELNKVINDTTNLRVVHDKKITMYGLDFTELVMPRGRILFYSHPLLSIHPLYKKSAFILDFSSIRYVSLKGRDTMTLDDIQTKGEDVRRGMYLTECSLETTFGGLTNVYLGNVSAT